MNIHDCAKLLFNPLRSRKVRVALATVISAYLAEFRTNVSEEVIYTILAVGVAIILGIAHEDAGTIVGRRPPKP